MHGYPMRIRLPNAEESLRPSLFSYKNSKVRALVLLVLRERRVMAA
jgi:hypothetical protein